jgi:putative Holliday junction resolvase
LPGETGRAHLGVDVGTVRIGVAVSDPDGRVAVPLATVPRGPGDVEALAALGEERGVAGYVVGLPRTLSGAEGPAAAASRRFADDLARRVAPAPVVLVDERLTTAAATQALRGAGRSARQSRPVVDQVAATTLLQGALDTTRGTGRVAGEVVVVTEREPTRGEGER